MLGPMPTTAEAREAMLDALEAHLGAELTGVLSEMLPSQPWREQVPSEHWLRRPVWEVVANADRQRFALHGALIALIGRKHAGTLMEHLVPGPWRELERLGVPLPDPKAHRPPADPRPVARR